LKANYRIEFIIANLNLELDNTDKIALFIQEAKNGNIDILPPDINKSSAKFTIEFYNNKKAIRYGLAAIKNVGIIVIKDIAKEREMRGDFENLVSFVERNSGANLNKKIYENLAKAGAFDNIHANRQQIIENIEYIISYAEEYKINKNSNQLGLFAVDDGNINKFELRPIKKSSNLQQVADEFKVFGFYLHNHPLDQYKDFLVKLNLNCYEDIIEHKIGHKETCLLAVVPQELMIRSSAKGRFAYLSVSDQSSSFEVAIFEQKLLDENRYYYEDNHPLLLKIDVLYNEENSFRLIVKEVQYLMDHILNHHNNILINADKADFLDVLTNCGAGNHKLKLVLECNNKIVKAEINNGLNFRAMHYYKILQIVNKIKLEE
jgi:DNA polymerase-3 subunit alpha